MDILLNEWFRLFQELSCQQNNRCGTVSYLPTNNKSCHEKRGFSFIHVGAIVPEIYLTQISNWKKKAKTNLGILVFCPVIYLATLKVYTQFMTLALIEAEKSVTENLIGEKEKWTNKENDKQEEASSLLHNTSHTQHLYQISKSKVQYFLRNLTQYKAYPTFVPNFKILGAVIPEKS